MKVVIKEPKKDAEIRDISYLNLEKIIGADIVDKVSFPYDKNIVIAVDDAGKIKGLEPNIKYGYDVIAGTVVFMGFDETLEDYDDLTEAQLDLVFGYCAMFDYYDSKVNFIPV